MKKRSKLGTLRNKCDALMQIIGHRRNPFCLLCGKAQQVMHHFFPKSVSSFLRYNWDNLVPLCNGCHMRLHQSGDPSYEERIKKIKGQKWYNWLAQHARDYIKINTAYYENIYLDLEVMLIKEIESNNPTL